MPKRELQKQFFFGVLIRVLHPGSRTPFTFQHVLSFPHYSYSHRPLSSSNIPDWEQFPFSVGEAVAHKNQTSILNRRQPSKNRKQMCWNKRKNDYFPTFCSQRTRVPRSRTEMLMSLLRWQTGALRTSSSSPRLGFGLKHAGGHVIVVHVGAG